MGKKILSILSIKTGIPISLIKSKHRHSEFVAARRVFTHVMRYYLFHPTDTAKELNRDRTTILHHLDMVLDEGEQNLMDETIEYLKHKKHHSVKK